MPACAPFLTQTPIRFFLVDGKKTKKRVRADLKSRSKDRDYQLQKKVALSSGKFDVATVMKDLPPVQYVYGLTDRAMERYPKGLDQTHLYPTDRSLALTLGKSMTSHSKWGHPITEEVFLKPLQRH